MKKFVLLFIILTIFLLGCTSKIEDKTAAIIPAAIGTIVTDSMEPPVVRMITKAPKYVKAAPPKIIPLSYPYGVGIPTITNYGIAEGLPGTWIHASAIDREGHIWLATTDGISKYDGSHFTNYNIDNGIKISPIICLFIDSKNNIWIAGWGGLYIFDGKNFKRLIIDKEKAVENVIASSMFEDNRGTIWLPTTNDGLYKYEDSVFTHYTVSHGLPDKRIRNVIQDKHNDMLISTDKGVARFDGKTFLPYVTLPVNKEGKPPILRYCDSKGNIWFDDRAGGLGFYDGKQIKMYSSEDGFSNRYGGASASNANFLEDKKGNYWIGGADGVTKFDGQRFINYTEKDGLASKYVISLSEDAYGNIWVGTRDNGVSKIGNSDVVKLEPHDDFVVTLAVDNSGNKWVSRRDGIGKYNSNHIALYGSEFFLGGSGRLLTDHEGHLWFSVFDANKPNPNLIRFDGIGYTIYGKDQGLFLDFIAELMEDDANNVWLIGRNDVIKFDGSSFVSYGPAQGFSVKTAVCIFQDSKRNIWFGSRESGATKFEGKQFTNYTVHDGLPSNYVRRITEDGMGNIWFATTGGASKFDGSKFTNYKAKDGLSNFLSYVEYDSINNLVWFATELGLASLKNDQVNEDKPFFQHYTPRSGFDISSFYDFIVDNQGIVWGRDGRVFRFDYTSISNTKPIPLHIKNIRLDNKNISWNTLRKGAYPENAADSLTAINEMGLKFGKSFTEDDFRALSDVFGKVSYDSVAGSDFIPVNLVLPITNNNITIEFGSISTSYGKAIQYQYTLEGYDKTWSPLSSKTEANFGNMSEGKYTFHLKALSPFGSWSEASYSFKVLPPWYRTWWAYVSYILLSVIAIFTFIRWRTNALQKEKIILEEKVTTRTFELNESLEHLKSTQAQLIQSEKMASLGELTAGIAHEIQNPLNFVNNFSEVNSELIEDIRAELTHVKTDSSPSQQRLEEAAAILNDLESNQQKINHHGKRADAIVKGMLQHSRSSSGQKEPTDLNALCDEYLRLAYHGLKAKDQSFNASFHFEPDETLPKMNVVPQDIGRVLLNLINNAFYAVAEKSKSAGHDYQPAVSVSTKRKDNAIEIAVADNGNGIPDALKEKIFQPFFTTKPTGQGTGLGLSLSYDIVKAHGGEIEVSTQQNEGTAFSIQLPIR